VLTVPSRNRPPPPNKDDYRRIDLSTSNDDFYQEEGLPGHFTIGLPAVDDMVVDDEQEDAGMEEDNAEDEAEDVCDKEDLSLLEAFEAGLDLGANGPPLGFIDDYWFAEPDGDDETCGPVMDVNLMATDLCSSNCEARLFVINLCNSDCQASLFVRTLCYVCENSICYLLLLLMYLILHAFSNIHVLIIFVAFTNIHLPILRTNKPLSSLCLQVIETCQKRVVFETSSRTWLTLWGLRVIRGGHLLAPC
jgi:hypothetical protein